MADESSISFELDRFEWVDPSRLELEGSWNGVTRKLARAVLVIEVDGKRRRLRALPEDAGSPDDWKAAFGWKGGDIPRLQGAELEVGRGIVVDLPRPRSSKARAAATPSEPIVATTREEKDADDAVTAARADAEQAREAVKKLRAERDELKAERDGLRAAAQEAEALRTERDELRARAEEAEALRAAAAEADALRAERDELRARAEEADRLRPAAEEAEALRARAEEADSLRADAEEAQILRARAAEADDLRARAEEAEAELIALTNRAEAAEEALEGLRAEAKSDAPPDLARLRAELESVERERTELRAQLDSTTEMLERSSVGEKTQSMPPPTLEDGEDARARLREARRFDRLATPGEVGAAPRRTRRPAERTAKRAPEPTTSLADKVTDWVGAVIGARDDEDEGAKNGEAKRAKPEPTAQAPRAKPAQRTARRPVPARSPGSRRKETPSWPLRVAAIGLLAILMIALIILLSSVL
jgi:multidrug efflux pump subunit AcrA (membrane-fusion protein)